LSSPILRAGEWFLRSGIQESNGGVARYHRADNSRNLPISTEITGYTASALVYLHSLTHDPRYLDRTRHAADFLAHTAWDAAASAMPFELDGPSYFFDCGIIVRGLLAVWRATGVEDYLTVAESLGRAMISDFAAPDRGDFHPAIELPSKRPLARDCARWSLSSGCYQLKAAMAWWDLAEGTGDATFRGPYEQVLAYSLGTCGRFLPGHADRAKVMDRLHAYLYFLEGLLPRAADAVCASALCVGIQRVAQLLREIAPEFARSDVYAQLLRIRLYAAWAGAAPLDAAAADSEAEALADFQVSDGGFSFGRRGGDLLPHINPVSTAFALQALALYQDLHAQAHRHLLI
jgi:hypothetical protein